MVRIVNFEHKFTAVDQITEIKFCPVVRYAYFNGTNMASTLNSAELWIYPVSMRLYYIPNIIDHIDKFSKYLTLPFAINSEKEFFEPPGLSYFFIKCISYESDFLVYLVGK